MRGNRRQLSPFGRAALILPLDFLSRFTEFLRACLNRVLLGFNGFNRVLLGLTVFSWVLLGFARALLGFTGL